MAYTNSKPTTYVDFATDDLNNGLYGSANVQEPPLSKKQTGWDWGEPPPREWMNWIHRITNNWIKYFDERITRLLYLIDGTDGTLGNSTSSGSGTFNVYQVPSGKSAEVTINVWNDSGATAALTLFRSPTNSPTAVHTIQLDTLQIDEGLERSALVLKAGDYLSYKTDKAGVNVVVYGTEYTTLGGDIEEQNLITTNTETVIFPNTAAKQSTVDVSISMVDGSAASDSATCKLYVSTTNAAGGKVLNKASISQADTTGFELTDIKLSATDKLILVTSNIVGSVSTTVSGNNKG